MWIMFLCAFFGKRKRNRIVRECFNATHKEVCNVKTTERRRTMRKDYLIVIHCLLPVLIATSRRRMWTCPSLSGLFVLGYHYYIRKSGQIEPMRDEDTVGAHARGFNAISLGRCYEGGLDENGKGSRYAYFPPERGDASSGKRVVAALSGCKKVGHRDWVPTPIIMELLTLGADQRSVPVFARWKQRHGDFYPIYYCGG